MKLLVAESFRKWNLISRIYDLLRDLYEMLTDLLSKVKGISLSVLRNFVPTSRQGKLPLYFFSPNRAP